MKVLKILPALDLGGVERVVIDLTRMMKERGHHSVVISSGGQLVKDLQKMGITHYELPVHKKSLLSFALVPKLIEIIRREQIDVIHARSRVPAWLIWFAACRTGTPFVTTCHGYYSTHMLSRIMGWGKFVIAISRSIGRHMIDDFGVPTERIRLIHRGIDLSQFTYEQKKYADKKDVFRIINVGRLSPIKGQKEFLDAIHELRQKMRNLEVLIVGAEFKGKTKYTKRLQETIRQLGLDSCVKLLGTRRDIPQLIQQSDLLVLSTLVQEGFGRVVVEAGAVGTPVLATKVGGVLDIIDDGKEGVLVSPGDVQAMAEAMYRMLNNTEQLKMFSENLRKKVEKQFTLELMVDKTLAVYKEASKRQKILIVKLGAMGDLILGTPSFRMIRSRFPDAHISLLVDKKLSPIVSSCPYVNEVIPVARHKLSKVSYLLKVAKMLRREGYDMSVDFQNTKWTHLLAALSGIPRRYGFRRGKMGFLVNRHDRSFETVDSPVKHQFRILSKLGIKDLDEQLELWPDESSEVYVNDELKRHSINGSSKLVGFVMGSSSQWATKRWPIANFKELGEKLNNKYGCKIILIGAENELPNLHEFVKSGAGKFIDFTGKTSLQGLVSLVKRVDVVVAGDTAPLHVAAAVKTKIVTLFGPTDPKRHMPPSENATILTRHLPCQPCYKGECYEKEKLACLTKISVDEVAEAVGKYLES